jgi:hypothetical protein
VPVVGFLRSSRVEGFADLPEAVRVGLRESGHEVSAMSTYSFGQQLFLDRASELVAPALRERFLASIEEAERRCPGGTWDTDDEFIRVVNSTLVEFIVASRGGDVDGNVVLPAPRRLQ